MCNLYKLLFPPVACVTYVGSDIFHQVESLLNFVVSVYRPVTPMELVAL
jgi:hypothetical protein